jgi:hypothetical protein
MIFTWTPAAIQMLADIWNRAPDRTAVAVAADEVDRELRVDPDTLGRPSFGNVRVFQRTPLAVEFEVNEPDRIVTVATVWRIA